MDAAVVFMWFAALAALGSLHLVVKSQAETTDEEEPSRPNAYNPVGADDVTFAPFDVVGRRPMQGMGSDSAMPSRPEDSAVDL